jgi:hypothetical protein
MSSSIGDRVDICLDDYLESIAGLPADLRRTFDTIRGLDERQCKLQAFTQRALSRHRSKPSTRARELRTEDAMDIALDIADEKIALSMQLYDVIDGHIRRLEDELKGIDASMKAVGIDPSVHLLDDDAGAAEGAGGGGGGSHRGGGAATGAAAGTRGGGGGGTSSGRRVAGGGGGGLVGGGSGAAVFHAGSGGGAAGGGGGAAGGGGGGGAAAAGDGTVPHESGTGRVRRLNVNPEHELPINPSEPVYCICRQVAFGEMIACDNPDCEYEWFHYQVRARVCCSW